MIGFAMCASFCTVAENIEVLKTLVSEGYEIQPIMSETLYSTDTRFGRAETINNEVRSICGRKIIHTIVDAEPIGPSGVLEALVISPCTGNTLAKLAHGITDTSVTMAAKAMLRCDKPLIVALASNDALSANLPNMGILRNRKNFHFIEMSMDNKKSKPHSLVAHFEELPKEVKRIISKTNSDI